MPRRHTGCRKPITNVDDYGCSIAWYIKHHRYMEKGGKAEIKADEPKQETPPTDPCETCQYNKKETA